MTIPGVSPKLHKTQNLLIDASHKLDRAILTMAMRAGDAVRISNHPATQPLRYTERELERCLNLIASQLDVLQQAYMEYFSAIRSGARDFTLVHYRLGNILQPDDIDDHFF